MTNLKISFIWTTTLSVLLAAGLLTGCGKKENETPTTTPSPAKTGGIKSAEKTTFNEVTAHLDPGGNVYGYLNTTEWFEGLSGKVDGWRDTLLSLAPTDTADKTNLSKAFDFANHFVKASGLESIGGVGFSGIALEPGYYQSKFFVYRSTSSPDGLLWAATGKTARPLTELDWLPSETAWAMFSDLDVSATWIELKKELEKADIPEAAQGLQMMEKEIKKSTGFDLSQLLSSLGGEYGFVLTLDPNRKVAIPTFSEAKLDIPEPGLLIAVKVKNDQLFDLIDKNLKTQPNVISVDHDGLKMRTVPIPLPLPVALRPSVARYGDFLLIASSDTLVQNIVDTKNGKKPGLKTLPEFQRLAKGMPTEGNQLVYISENLSKAFQDVQGAILKSPLANSSQQKAAGALMQKAFQSSALSSAYSVGGHTSDGWLTIMHGNKNPVLLMAGPLVVAPLGILAGVTIPAFSKAKEKAQSVNCLNNLKQISMAARLWADDHDGRFPPDFISMTNELGSPKILVCPDDKNVPNREALTWENFDPSLCSYELLKPGTKVEDSATKVVFRCKIHGNTALGDGSVQKAKK